MRHNYLRPTPAPKETTHSTNDWVSAKCSYHGNKNPAMQESTCMGSPHSIAVQSETLPPRDPLYHSSTQDSPLFSLCINSFLPLEGGYACTACSEHQQTAKKSWRMVHLCGTCEYSVPDPVWFQAYGMGRCAWRMLM